MNKHARYTVPLVTMLLVSCTFGEGPELTLPESSETAAAPTTDVQSDAGQTMAPPATPATLLGQSDSPEDAANLNEQTLEPQAVTNSMPVTEDALSPPTGMVHIPRTDTANAPVINGDTMNYITGTNLLDGEWRFAVQSDDNGKPLNINNLMFEMSTALTESETHHWAAMHDGEYLYLLVVVDDAGEHSQDTDEFRKPWKDDSIELFIDGNNSRLQQYDGVDDFHATVNLQMSPGVANDSQGVNPIIRQSDLSATLPSDLSFRTGLAQGPESDNSGRGRKDIYELRIKLSELNIQLDTPFGIELQINDDDNGGSRDRKWAWRHPEGRQPSNDYTWENPSFMGQAILLR